MQYSLLGQNRQMRRRVRNAREAPGSKDKPGDLDMWRLGAVRAMDPMKMLIKHHFKVWAPRYPDMFCGWAVQKPVALIIHSAAKGTFPISVIGPLGLGRPRDEPPTYLTGKHRRL